MLNLVITSNVLGVHFCLNPYIKVAELIPYEFFMHIGGKSSLASGEETIHIDLEKLEESILWKKQV